MKYQVIKTYGFDQGWSCCYRQWRAKSHCKYLHGYSVSFKLTFEAADLDECNWVIDFGSLRPIKDWIQLQFDHKLLVAADDPIRYRLFELCDVGGADVKVLPAVSCEMFAKLVFDHVEGVLFRDTGYHDRVKLVSVEAAEHAGNRAVCLA